MPDQQGQTHTRARLHNIPESEGEAFRLPGEGTLAQAKAWLSRVLWRSVQGAEGYCVAGSGPSGKVTGCTLRAQAGAPLLLLAAGQQGPMSVRGLLVAVTAAGWRGPAERGSLAPASWPL